MAPTINQEILQNKQAEEIRRKSQGRPKLLPPILTTSELISNLTEKLSKNLSDFNEIKPRADTIRFKLVRKACTIPYLIRNLTQTSNSIKVMDTEQAKVVYTD